MGATRQNLSEFEAPQFSDTAGELPTCQPRHDGAQLRCSQDPWLVHRRTTGRTSRMQPCVVPHDRSTAHSTV